MPKNIQLQLDEHFPEVREFSHTKIYSAKSFTPSFEDKSWTSILYIEKGNFQICYETGEILSPKGGMFYYHPPLSLKYQTFDKKITPYSMFRLAVDFSKSASPLFSSQTRQNQLIKQLPAGPFVRKAPSLMISSFKTIIKEYEEQIPGYLAQIENSIRQILISAIRSGDEKDSTSSGTQNFVKNVDHFLDHNKEFMGPVEHLFEHLGVRRSQGYDIFRQVCGISPKDYIIRKKIEYAKQLLLGDMDITSIAYELGFSSSQSFATVFKKLTCTTPSNYRHQNKKTEK